MPRSAPTAVTHLPVGAILGSAAKVAVLRVLTGTSVPLSQREVARRARFTTRSVQLALEDLSAAGIVRRIEGGRDRLVLLNEAHGLAAQVEALFRAESALFGELREELVTIGRRADATGLAALALFGSVARGEERLESDLDLLIIGHDQSAADRLLDAYLAASAAMQTRFGVRLNPIAYALRSARRMWRHREAPLPELARDAVMLSGPPLTELLA